MKEENSCTVVCEQMSPHNATIFYRGAICQIGASAMERQFKSLFDYYQYDCVDVRLESPGGSIDSMHYILRKMTDYEERGKKVSVRSTFVCASAAAILLAMGRWGNRIVDRSTTLLFHTSRIDTTGHGMTAAISVNLSQTLAGVDHRLVDVLINRMSRQAGGENALANLVIQRCRYVNENWDTLAESLNSLFSEGQSKRRPDWFKSLTKITRQGLEKGRFLQELKKLIHNRMQHDVRMDLREAFCLCLIDEVTGVLKAS
jgi:ATP-dependent protease ClpP protease subunit